MVHVVEDSKSKQHFCMSAVLNGKIFSPLNLWKECKLHVDGLGGSYVWKIIVLQMLPEMGPPILLFGISAR